MLLMFIPVVLLAQNVTGTVTDAQNGEPLIGVTVKSLDGTGRLSPTSTATTP